MDDRGVEWTDPPGDEDPQDRQARIEMQAREAEMILNHPAVRKFLHDQRQRLWDNLRAMPLGNTHWEQYQALHAYDHALDQFERTLRAYVENRDEDRLRRALGENAKHTDRLARFV